MTIKLSDTLLSLSPKYLVKQNARIRELKNEGKEIINLGRGNPDLPTFPLIVEELQKKIEEKENHGYPPYSGKDSFLESIQAFYQSNYTVLLEKKEIAVSQGSAVALSNLAQVLLNPGDTALVPDPSFTGYESSIKLAGGVPYFLPLKQENNFLLDYKDIPTEVAKKAKVLILNYPNNPTGATATKEFFEETVQFAKEYQLIVIHDFAYANIFYGEDRPLSFLEIEGAKEVGVETYTLSKTFNMAGWRSAFIVGNQTIIEGVRTYFQNATGGFFGAVQDASSFALTEQDKQREELRTIYEKRKEKVVELLTRWEWSFFEPRGSFFIWAKVPTNQSSKQFTEKILEETGVALIPGTVYGDQGEGWVRISLVTTEEFLEKGLRKIKDEFLL